MIGVIFDCDGTLLDSMQEWHDVDYRLAERGGVEVTQADRDFMTRATLEESAEYIHRNFGVGSNGADVMQIILDEMLEFYRHEAKPKPGALEFVRQLHELGIPMGVASSTPGLLLRTGLESAGFAPYMDIVLSVDDLGTSKREPLIFDAIRERLGTERENTWGVDDAVYAIDTLRDAGYRTLAVYDSEIAGSPSALEKAADVFIMSLDGFSGEALLETSNEVQVGKGAENGRFSEQEAPNPSCR